MYMKVPRKGHNQEAQLSRGSERRKNEEQTLTIHDETVAKTKRVNKEE